VTPTFDGDSAPTTTTAKNSCKSNNNYCGTANSAVTDQTVVTTTIVTVGNTSVKASAADFNSSVDLTEGTGTLTTPATGTDGKIPVTVTATVSEDVTTTVTVVTTNQTCTTGKGATCTTVGTPTTVATPSTVTKTGSGNGSGSYTLDINPPTLVLDPEQSQPTVQQGGDKNMHNHLEQGSAGTPYTTVDTVTSSDLSYSSSTNGQGSFGPQGRAVDLVGVHLACSAPLGTYKQGVTANTQDLGGFPFDPLTYTAPETFSVVAGASLQNQTYIVSDTADGYNTMSCFNATQSGRKIGSNPGSFHLATVINTLGKCAGIDSMQNTVVTMTLPAGFIFDVTGGSPAAHVFIVDATNGFDYHYPGPEISLPKNAISGANTGTLTVNLANVVVNGGAPGVIPGSTTIYVRAHIAFNGTISNGTPYSFNTNVGSTLANVGASSAAGTATLTQSSACVNGN